MICSSSVCYCGLGARCTSATGRRLTELRTSNAAGKHGKRAKDRWNLRRKAVERDVRDSS